MKYDIRSILKKSFQGEIERWINFRLILEDRESLKEAIRLSPRTYGVIVEFTKIDQKYENFLNDVELANIALKSGVKYKDLVGINPSLKENFEVAQTAVKLDGMNMEFLSYDNAKKADLAIEACIQNIGAREFIKDESLKDYCNEENINRIKEKRKLEIQQKYDEQFNLENKIDNKEIEKTEENISTLSDEEKQKESFFQVDNSPKISGEELVNQITKNNNIISQLEQQLEALKLQNATLEQSLSLESDGRSIWNMKKWH